MKNILYILLIFLASCEPVLAQRQAMEASANCNKWVTACGATALSTKPAVSDIRNVNQFLCGEQSVGQIPLLYWVDDFACANATDALVSIVNGYLSATNVNSVRHVADSGFEGNGSNNYIQQTLSYTPSVSLNNQFNSIFYQHNSGGENGGGSFSGTATNLVNNMNATHIIGYCNDNTGVTTIVTYTLPALSTVARVNSTQMLTYYNSTLESTTASSSTVTNTTQFIAYGAFNANGTMQNFSLAMASMDAMGNAIGMNWVQYYNDCLYFTRP